MEEIHVLRAAVHFALAANRERVALSLDLYFLGINPRKRDTAVVLFTVGVNEGLNGGSEGGRSTCSLTSERPSAHHTIKDLIKIPSEVEQILKETIARNKIGHDIPPDPKFLAPRKREHVMARSDLTPPEQSEPLSSRFSSPCQATI